MRKTATVTFEVTVVVEYDDTPKVFQGVVASVKENLAKSVHLAHFIGRGSGTAKSKTAKFIRKELHWKTWSGKKTKCPVPSNTQIDVCFADGRILLNHKAGSLAWAFCEAYPHNNIAKWRYAS